jgi:ribonuclease Z
MSWDVKVITVPSRDSDLSLVVTFAQHRYIINTGEGLQRACTQRGVAFRKLDAVLLTQSGSEVVAGLPGVLMTATDSGVPKIKVAGPEDALQYLVSCRTFLQR